MFQAAWRRRRRVQSNRINSLILHYTSCTRDRRRLPTASRTKSLVPPYGQVTATLVPIPAHMFGSFFVDAGPPAFIKIARRRPTFVGVVWRGGGCDEQLAGGKGSRFSPKILEPEMTGHRHKPWSVSTLAHSFHLRQRLPVADKPQAKTEGESERWTTPTYPSHIYYGIAL
jgi:hypothetical protein